MRSVMRYHDMDDLDEGIMMLNQPEKKSSSCTFTSSQPPCLTLSLVTQSEQDEEDEKERKRAMRNLVNSWQERLQLISVIVSSRIMLFYVV